MNAEQTAHFPEQLQAFDALLTGMASKVRKRGSSFSTRDYVEALSQHAEQSSHSTLYPGFVYKGLCEYLKGPALPPDGSNAGNHTQVEARHHACLYALDPGTSHKVEKCLDLCGCLRALQSNAENGVSQILFLNGYACPKWLTGVASALSVEPEFLNSNMRFRCIRGYRSNPGLPSAYENILRLCIVTIGSRETKNIKDSDPRVIEQLRTEAKTQMLSYRQKLETGKDVQRGDSIVREYHVLSERHFFLEQEISINLSIRKGTWTALVLSDIGKPLSGRLQGPWLSTSDLQSNVSKTIFYPTVQHLKRIAFRASTVSSEIQNTMSHQFPQTASLLGLDYGRLLNRSAMSSDPFYALRDLFQFAAASENQLLNLMDSYVGNIKGHTTLNDEHPSLENLRYYQGVLQAHLERLSETIETIQLRGCSRWPRAAKDHAQFSRVEASADWLLRDYKRLYKRALAISQRCDRGMSVIMNDMNLAESKRAIAQAESVKRLTVIAFVYIPLSFTTSLFGMNVQQLGSGVTPIWVWAASSVFVLLLTVMVFFLNTGFVKRLRSMWKVLTRPKQEVKGDAIMV